MVPPTSVAFSRGTGGKSGRRLAASTEIEASSDSAAMEAFLGSILAWALFGETMAAEPSVVAWECEMPAQAMQTIAKNSNENALFVDTGFTPPLDAVCGMKVVTFSEHVGYLSLLLANVRGSKASKNGRVSTNYD